MSEITATEARDRSDLARELLDEARARLAEDVTSMAATQIVQRAAQIARLEGQEEASTLIANLLENHTLDEVRENMMNRVMNDYAGGIYQSQFELRAEFQKGFRTAIKQMIGLR